MSCREIQIFTGASQLKWAPEQEPKGKKFMSHVSNNLLELLTNPLSTKAEHGVSLVWATQRNRLAAGVYASSFLLPHVVYSVIAGSGSRSSSPSRHSGGSSLRCLGARRMAGKPDASFRQTATSAR